jgi:hypothetical protein
VKGRGSVGDGKAADITLPIRRLWKVFGFYQPIQTYRIFKDSSLYFYSKGFLRMIRHGNFADHGSFQKTIKEPFESYGFLKTALVLIGWRSPLPEQFAYKT